MKIDDTLKGRYIISDTMVFHLGSSSVQRRPGTTVSVTQVDETGKKVLLDCHGTSDWVPVSAIEGLEKFSGVELVGGWE